MIIKYENFVELADYFLDGWDDVDATQQALDSVYSFAKWLDDNGYKVVENE